jgi:hypothetical protein
MTPLPSDPDAERQRLKRLHSCCWDGTRFIYNVEAKEFREQREAGKKFKEISCMKLIYIAGPYRATAEYLVADNIQRAEAMAREVWKRGAVAICPHKNTAFMGGLVPDEEFLFGDLEILKRCDAVLCTHDWRRSEGARSEVLHAGTFGKPVFESLGALSDWLRKGLIDREAIAQKARESETTT